MNRRPVSSQVLASVGYDEKKSRLEIEFKDRSIRQYFNVPSSTYEALMTAPSRGEFFFTEIHTGYKHEQIKGKRVTLDFVSTIKRWITER